jgi:1,4-dihydroxy-2-naphthoate octaprenyltransferase
LLGRLLKYVEIKTKITSVLPFLLAIAFLFSKGQAISIERSAVFFVSMFFLDLATTAINNYIDAKNSFTKLPFERKTALAIIYALLALSTIFGIILVVLTDLLVLFIGGICFLCGIFYTYGPLAISRQPLGELFSGVFYGFFIPFLILYINMPTGHYFNVQMSFSSVSIEMQVMPLLTVFLLSVSPVCLTANIMLANNICDLEKDLAVKRHTLPYYLGDKALLLYELVNYTSYIAISFMVLLKMLHPLCMAVLLTLIPVRRNVRVFLNLQNKCTTFNTSIKNYVIIMGALITTVFISSFI